MALKSYIPSIPPILFAVVVVSVLSTKILHILQHVQSLPFVYFVLYSPTLFLLDFLVITVLRLLLHSPENRLQWVTFYLGVVLALTTWFAASVQFGFFLETGSEVQWAASESFVRDPAAMKILFSGIYTVIASGAVIFGISFFISNKLYSMTGRWLHAVRDRCWESIKEPRSFLPTSKPVNIRRCSFHWLLPTSAITISLFFLLLTRPPIPYNHLSGAIPLTMLDAFKGQHGGCRPRPKPFPFLDDNNDSGHFRRPLNWAFGSKPAEEEVRDRPSWLPEDIPPGFHRWEVGSAIHEDKYGVQAIQCAPETFEHYNAARDPMKVSNLHEDVLPTLKDAFKDVDIQHVVLIILESGRKELFPTQPGTPLYDALLDSHDDKDKEDAMDKLAQMTLVSQMLSGEYAVDSLGQPANLSESKWEDATPPEMGGINVKGALTGSSLTLKSMMMAHCGVQPLPVDLLEEAGLDIYQPCLPQILELFNRKNASAEEIAEKPFLNYPWKSVFTQPCTDSYDRQHILQDRMGFESKITKEVLEDVNATHYPPKTEEVNYFGFAEEETYPYLRDLVYGAKENNTRLFLSHMTSSTHHPWGTPENFTHVQYMGKKGSVDHNLMNNYLNTIRYVDQWLGDIMGLLDEAGVSNQTLIAIVGDHGQAFGEDAKVTGTFENGHISNFRVPLIFRHPQLPRVHVEANATSLTILPTILDLMIQTKSLKEEDLVVANDILPEYQGQSMIRPFQNEREDGMPVWNFALINSGGSMLAITSTTAPYRLIMPLKTEFAFRFTHLGKDPGETQALQAWTMPRLLSLVTADHGEEAAAWLEEAVKVGHWWVDEQKRVWDYRGRQ